MCQDKLVSHSGGSQSAPRFRLIISQTLWQVRPPRSHKHNLPDLQSQAIKGRSLSGSQKKKTTGQQTYKLVHQTCVEDPPWETLSLCNTTVGEHRNGAYWMDWVQSSTHLKNRKERKKNKIAPPGFSKAESKQEGGARQPPSSESRTLFLRATS